MNCSMYLKVLDLLYIGTVEMHSGLQMLLIYTNCKKKVQPMQKRQHEKSCEIKGGGPEVAVVV